MSAYALTTKLFPTHFSPPDPVFADRLSVPLGYWNALGIFAAMGAVLAVGCAGHERSRIVRAGSAVAACVVVPTMLFTFSRGALAAMVIGVVAMVILDSRRIELLASAVALAIPVGFLVWLGLASGPLTEPGTPVVEAAEAGRGYAAWVAALACAAVLLNEAAHLVVVRLNPGRSAERRFGIALCSCGPRACDRSCDRPRRASPGSPIARGRHSAPTTRSSRRAIEIAFGVYPATTGSTTGASRQSKPANIPLWGAAQVRSSSRGIGCERSI